ATVLLPGRAPLRGAVVAGQPDGVEVSLPRDIALCVGERVRLELCVDGVERAAVLRAQVVARDELSAERRYGFRFVGQSDLDQPRRSVSGRRSDPFRLSAPMKIGLHLDDSSRLSGSPAIHAMLDGASRDGCSFVVDAATERALCEADRVLIEVRRGPTPGESGTT